MLSADGSHTSSKSFATQIENVVTGLGVAAGEWVVEVPPPDLERWIDVRHRGARLREQGWKLHVSAAVPSAGTTLGRVLPVLLGEPVAFKVAASPQALATLNEGGGGLSQIGKFVTVYPVDDEQAVRLAVRLAEATAGLPGPPVPSDRRLRRAGLVYYRYGSFAGLTIQRLTGEVSLAIRNPDGGLEPDLRGLDYRSPAWATDPFVAAGVTEEAPSRPRVLGDRFLLLGVIYRSARGGVYLAVDLERPGNCVVKHAEAGASLDGDGRDARDQLRNEAAVVERLTPHPRFPAILALVEHEDDLYLAMEDSGTRTLERYVMARNARGCTLDHDRVVAWGRELLALLATIHEAGLVYNDLKSTNVIVAADDGLCLVDFEQACEQGSPDRPPGRGTRGYMSPQQVAGEPADARDDVYAFGALLAYLATGAEPSQTPRPSAPLARPLDQLRPGIHPGLAAVIARCLAADPAARFSSVGAVDAALAALGPGTTATIRAAEPVLATADEAAARERCRDLSRRVGDALCHAARPSPGREGLAWASNHPLGPGILGRDINTGAAGTLLALADLVAELGDPRHRDVLARGALWLANAPAPGGEPLPGLYVGEAGVAAALLRAGQVLGDDDLLRDAQARSRRIAAMPHRSPDLFNGSAGRLRFHLILWDESGDPGELAAALAAGEHLLATMEDCGEGARRWTIPPGYGGQSGEAYLGYAHGAAGIADALLELAEATDDARFGDAARGAARWLARLAAPTLDDGTGLGWPRTESAEFSPPYWCHGSAGIGRFWLHAAALDLLPEAAELAAGAIAMTARGAPWAAPPPCHGLAGSIELLLDAYQATSDPRRLAEARALERLLSTFAQEHEGQLVWPSESPDVVTPDYHVGYAGVAATLLRLSDPERLPHGLGRSGFRVATEHLPG